MAARHQEAQRRPLRGRRAPPEPRAVVARRLSRGGRGRTRDRGRASRAHRSDAQSLEPASPRPGPRPSRNGDAAQGEAHRGPAQEPRGRQRLGRRRRLHDRIVDERRRSRGSGRRGARRGARRSAELNSSRRRFPMAFGDVCLVLGGGGARGLAHLGVLQVFEREDIPVNCIVGTSVGAVVGACYAVCPDALGESRRALAYFKSPSFSGNAFKKVLLKSPDVEVGFLGNLVASIRKSYIFSNLLRKPSIFPGERLYEVIADLVPDKDFKDCQIPFAVPALDIQTGDEILITEGSLRQAVYASCSLPGFFPPVEHQGRLLADAGVIGPVPVRAAKALFQPSVTVAVDITSRLEPLEELGCGLDVLLRVETIAGSRL